ncbi:hypothetical protein [Leptolyngbya sp. 7M]|uniref:hypothetical protein n=1 Tax=Leptolyngbya sp. 7M TaxID=2812896 RepID=UPI001B8C6B9F|nr:hypothetical protein [Leptolyngbya sp. 7M]QYO66299.1 hypothetical protein JVX88_05730 [Leptolyngbya sp. 7M]
MTSHFTFVTNAAYGETPPTGMFMGAAVYAIVFNSILIVMAILIFRRRNFK